MDLKDVKTVGELLEIFKNQNISMYDDSPSYEDQNTPQLNDGLSAEEIENAMFWYPFTRGVMLVAGPPGAGKGLFANMLAWKLKRYFKDKVVIMDYKPRRPFGFYIPFTRAMLVEQLERLQEISGWDEGSIDRFPDEVSKFDNHQWRSSRGDVFIHNAVMVLDEFHEYMDRRNRPPIGHVLGDIFKFWRHMNLLTIAITTQKSDLDYKRFQKAVTSEVRCSWSVQKVNGKRTSTIAKIQPLQFADEGGGILKVKGRMIKRRIDGAAPREALGGLRYFDLFNTTNVKSIGIPKSLAKEVHREQRQRNMGDE